MVGKGSEPDQPARKNGRWALEVGFWVVLLLCALFTFLQSGETLDDVQLLAVRVAGGAVVVALATQVVLLGWRGFGLASDTVKHAVVEGVTIFVVTTLADGTLALGGWWSSTPSSSPSRITAAPDSGPTVSGGSTSTPTVTPPAPPGPTSAFRMRVTVPANTNAGATVLVPAAGQYRISYVSGAYSVYPAGTVGAEWRTTVELFLDGQIVWEGDNLVQNLGPARQLGLSGSGLFADAAAAQNGAAGWNVVTALPAGNVVFVAIDNKTAYADNQGTVVFEVESAP
jgi:hypothetical protein